MQQSKFLRTEIQKRSPRLWAELNELAKESLAPALRGLEEGEKPRHKSINDPVWGVVDVMPWEVVLLDTPFLQRLRGIHQLGMAHYVYPGATHTRLEHTIGVLEATERIFRRLERSVEQLGQAQLDHEHPVPPPTENDRKVLRLAALLHDTGHGPYSHISEWLIASRFGDEFETANRILLEHFQMESRIQPAELVSVVFVLSEPMERLLGSSGFGGCALEWDMAHEVAGKILGSLREDFSTKPYLGSVISGPLDADKLDYMARDSHHTGLPIGIDVDRLISKLQVVEVSESTTQNEYLLARARKKERRRYYDLAISLAGVAAYEQMIMARVILFDRLYHHHKIRAAEQQFSRFLARTQEGRVVALKEVLSPYTDEAATLLMDVTNRKEDWYEGSAAQRLFTSLTRREIHHRAYCFASRFIAGLDGITDKKVQGDLRAESWAKLMTGLLEPGAKEDLAKAILGRAKELASKVTRFAGVKDKLEEECVVVDLPEHKAVAGGHALFATSEGSLSEPNTYFEVAQWMGAYKDQKQCGYVFSPKALREVVGVASAIEFHVRFGLAMNTEAVRLCKLDGTRMAEILREAAAKGICQLEVAASIETPKPVLTHLSAKDLKLPKAMAEERAGFGSELCDEIRRATPSGLLPEVRDALGEAIGHVAHYLWSESGEGALRPLEDLAERELQTRVRGFLRSRGVEVQEGTEVGGGETDLILPGNIVLENKTGRRAAVLDPFNWKEEPGVQARRYCRHLGRKVFLVLLAYKPKDETAIRSLTGSIRVMPVRDGGDGYVEVRCVVPFGYVSPSKAGKGKRVRKS